MKELLKSLLAVVLASTLMSFTGQESTTSFQVNDNKTAGNSFRCAPGAEILRCSGKTVIIAPYPHDGRFRYATGLSADGTVKYGDSDSMEEAVAATQHLVDSISGGRSLKIVIESSVLEKAARIKEIQRSQRDGFFFWTDTHLQTNMMNAPMYIRLAVDPARPQKVVFGGDAIPAFTDDIDRYWNIQQKLDKEIMGFASLYCLRGNHDFTCKFSPKVKEGRTWTQEKTAIEIAGSMNGVVCRNEKDSGCYYYFDVPESRMRYLVFDTTDSAKAGDVAFGVMDGISDVQFDWMFRNAVLAAPKGYSLVILSHVPANVNMSSEKKYPHFAEAVNAIARHTDFNLDSRKYRFSKRKDLNLLFCLSGHHHHDMQFFTDDVLGIITTCDACYNDFTRSPFITRPDTNRKNTELCQALDYVSISKDSKTVTMTRMGVGDDRVYHLDRTVIRKGGKAKLRSSLDGKCTWSSYDGTGNRYVKGPNYTGRWELANVNVSVGADGSVSGLNAGEAIVVASRDGVQEFFLVRVEP